MHIPILYIDKNIIVIQKPPGVLCEESGKGDSVFPVLRAHCRSLGEEEDIYPVHRLDRETGGVMVYARSQTCAAYLSRLIAEGKLQKTYLAEVSGCLSPPAGMMEDYLFHDRTKNKTYVVKRQRKGVKKAVLTYETVQTSADYSLLRIQLQTGRTHQIRVQCASRLHPLRGDRKYGGDKADRLYLWAQELCFPAPNGEMLRFCAPAPFGITGESL